MQTHIITIKPDAIENKHDDLPFDLKQIKKPDCTGASASASADVTREIVPSDTRVRYAVSFEMPNQTKVLQGYVNTMEFALELVRLRFSDMMRKYNEGQGDAFFAVKYEHPEKPCDKMTQTPPSKCVCKLYQANQSIFYLYGKTKLMTIYIDPMPRLEFKKQS